MVQENTCKRYQCTCDGLACHRREGEGVTNSPPCVQGGSVNITEITEHRLFARIVHVRIHVCAGPG